MFSSTSHNSLNELCFKHATSFVLSFASKADLISYLPQAKINPDDSSFQNHLSAVIYDLELFCSTNHEEPLHGNDFEDTNLSVF